MIPNEWTVLSEKLLQIPTINKSRVDPETLFNAYMGGSTFVLKNEVAGKTVIHAFGALWATKMSGWLEMGTMYVSPEYRGVGIISNMFHELLVIAKNGGKSTFLVTSNQTIASVASGAEWIEADIWDKAPCYDAVVSQKTLGDGRRLFYRHQSTS